jgi:ribosomal protein S18 acetylase RimI-like enzyme
MWVIRKAEQHDAALLAALAEKTFRETFGAANTSQDMNQHCNQTYGISIQAREILDPEIDTFVCELGGNLIAYAQLSWQPAPSCVNALNPVEIRRFYVDSAWHGKGIANALMTALLEHMTAKHADQVWLGVWEHNPKARKFYQKMGFLEVGSHVFQLGNDPQRDLILSRKVESEFTSNNP